MPHFHKRFFLGAIGSLIVIGLLGLGGMSVKSYLVTTVSVVPVVFGLSFAYVFARTQIPEEVRSDQVLVEIAAQELRLYNHLEQIDTEPSARAGYEDIAKAQAEIRGLSRRADLLWARIPPGTVIMRNNNPVGTYRDVLDIRADVRSQQAELDSRKRSFALERSTEFETATVRALVLEQQTLTAEQAQLEKQIEEFEASAVGKSRRFSQIMMVVLAIAAIAGFYWLIISV